MTARTCPDGCGQPAKAWLFTPPSGMFFQAPDGSKRAATTALWFLCEPHAREYEFLTEVPEDDVVVYEIMLR